ncbi:response regulator transcription factor [Diaphorobacter sp. HDW4B]|uniref:LuxR C-terminal-related transcriptional regulator n=1 Tax=Diaphorobacter sp. HDW4B TaxID=2714925 RepID=UPI00140D25D9|nr:LuxR C-terminal-related transcriptional regulator [Diaphorobacter sp. HDW4B]QIL70350.1 response regulator transcription factor [Diaphorobacter sp. HDW4B]
MPSADYNDLLLRLYRLSHEQPIDQFQDSALELLKQVLPFDSAMWGSATMTGHGIDIHAIHLHKQSVEMLSAYEEVKHLDTAGQEAARRVNQALAFDRDAWFSAKHQQSVREYGKRFEQAHFFISGTLDQGTNITHWVTLFRSDTSAHCMERERVALGGFAPHVHQALSLNRLTHLNQRVHQQSGYGVGTAMSDPRGVIYHMDAVFSEAMRAEWSGWLGPRLPGSLMKAVQQGLPRFTGHAVVISLRAEHGLLWLRCRPRCAADDLAPREFVVAQMTAKGLTHKEIARALERAPTTVRNQIRSIYDKLGVGNVAELIEALRLVE